MCLLDMKPCSTSRSFRPSSGSMYFFSLSWKIILNINFCYVKLITVDTLPYSHSIWWEYNSFNTDLATQQSEFYLLRVASTWLQRHSRIIPSFHARKIENSWQDYCCFLNKSRKIRKRNKFVVRDMVLWVLKWREIWS